MEQKDTSDTPQEAHTFTETVAESATENSTAQKDQAYVASPTKQTPGRCGTIIGVLAIIIALATGAGVYFYGTQQSRAQTERIQQLQNQIAALQTKGSGYEQQISQQTSQLNSSHDELGTFSQRLEQLKTQVDTITDNDSRNWLLAQADFLINMAGRKVWSEQDVVTAVALLKSADSSLAKMHDPALTDVRRALREDISRLSAISQIDYDGIILSVSQLANDVDSLRLADNRSDGTPMDQDSGELSSSLREWRQNLVKSWHNFMDNFITIRRRDTNAEPLLAPDQDVYLRENIRSRLLVAAQAVPRHQNEIFQQSLDTVSTWTRTWFDEQDPTTKAFLAQLDELSQQSINMELPEKLASQSKLEKLMQNRVNPELSQITTDTEQSQEE